jgi:hypothetical protein
MMVIHDHNAVCENTAAMEKGSRPLQFLLALPTLLVAPFGTGLRFVV